MLTAAARSRLSVVLVGARNPQNIGAVARAMHDFGFADLRVANGFTLPFEAAQIEASSAVNAGSVLRTARIFATLPEAVADCTLVAGTTAVGERGLQQPVLTLQDAAQSLLTAMARVPDLEQKAKEVKHDVQPGVPNRVALLFGSEKTGLTKEELSFCSLLLTVPMFAAMGRHLSMNLGQAVAVCLYELTRSGFEGSRSIPGAEPRLATTQDRERLLGMLVKVMEHSGYSQRFPANARKEIVRQLALPLSDTSNGAATWMGIFRHLLRVLPQKPSERSD